ncbi:hypothetical protein M422DRAFT_239090 [Sphaerobolus stellatus SS14]|nr:hypothetical protein M422DRAFT_239090 [Sphaerobolus stellatus SS14]
MLLTLPIDVLESILYELEEPSPLLSLGLTSKQLCELITPYHLQSRFIRCGAWREDVWNSVLDSPHVLDLLWGIEVMGDLALVFRDILPLPSCFQESESSGEDEDEDTDTDTSTETEPDNDVDTLQSGILALSSLLTMTAHLK